MNNILKQRLAAQQVARSEHPSADTLTAFAERNLKAPQRETVMEHLAACADCRQAVMLATSEVSVEQAAIPLPSKPLLQFPAGMRWASLAAALAVAVGVGLVLNDHQAPPRQSRLGKMVQPTAAPTTQPTPETSKQESEKKYEGAKDDVLQASAANKVRALSEKKKTSLSASREQKNPGTASRADVGAASRLNPLASTDRASNYAGLKQEAANAFAPNQESDQKLATAKALPAAPPPPPVAEAFHGQSGYISGSGANGGVARTQLAAASANQTVDVLQGAVTDASGAAVGGAELTVTNVATDVTYVVKSGQDGNYRVDPIPAGIYKIEVARPGFSTATAERVETLVGTSTTQNFKLQIGPPTETVAVSAEAPQLNAVRTDVGQNSTTAEVSTRNQAGIVQIPLKAPPAAGVSGSFRKAQTTQLRAGIVNWAISDTGQLQRTLSDGATTNVQPAPGMTVRAVAAGGIEVWAAGTRADLAAKEWTQHPVLFHSSDAGKTWSRVDGPWQGPITQLSLAANGNLVVSTQNGTWSTNDAGKTWAPVAVKTKD